MTTQNKKITKFTILLFICVLIFCFYRYSSKDRALEKYYNQNVKLHQELGDSLMAFSKAYKTDIILKKNNLPDNAISFVIHFHDSAEFIPVYFDTALNRHDYIVARTGKFIISKSLIEKFKRSIYFAIGSDSSYTFFAKEWYTPIGIGSRADLQYGILVSTDTTQTNNPIRKITKDVVIVTRGIF